MSADRGQINDTPHFFLGLMMAIVVAIFVAVEISTRLGLSLIMGLATVLIALALLSVSYGI